MPDLVNRLPAKRSETFDQAFGRVRARARREVTAKYRPKWNMLQVTCKLESFPPRLALS
jgi:hypothetical protein